MEIPFCKAHITEDEVKAVSEVIRSGWLTAGSKCKEFEEKFADYVGAKYAVSVNSCTSALFLCLKYLQMREHRYFTRIGVPSFTFTASASVIVHCHKKPIFLDVDRDDYCLNEYQSRLKDCDALISVHLTGNGSMTEFGYMPIIEDSAHRIERNTQGNNPVCYSFYATKNLTTGEGGMITTNNEQMYEWLKLARLHGSNKDGFNRYANKGSWEYSIDFCGWKMNMTDVAAAIGLVQLQKLDWMNGERQRCVEQYNQKLGYKNTGLHLYPIFVDSRTEFMRQMLEAGIHCSVHFLPLHQMKAYEDYGTDDLQNTEWLGAREVSLPLYPSLSNQEIDYVCEKVLKTGLLLEK